ncbi:MAG: GYD domain-containing protein [Methanolinea sp.]|jgi:uncharacterized protein with GYD domain|nr:GYD domain-containing protein [Methanolinea sp.]
MPTYIVLGKLTNKAIETNKSTKERDAMVGKTIRDAGGTLLNYYYTIGRYDFIATLEMPSAEILTRVLLEMSRWGTMITETMTAINPVDMY